MSYERSSAGSEQPHHASEVFLFYRDKELFHIHTDRKTFETWMKNSPWQYPTDLCEIVRYVPAVAQGASRQPDLMDASGYTNIDIAKRMWESFNATGDRWFKYAAQRLEAAHTAPQAAPSDGAIYAAVSQRHMTDAEREQLDAALSRPQHSPAPWAANDDVVSMANGLIVAECYGGKTSESCANAAFIVKAVNAHDALVEYIQSSASAGCATAKHLLEMHGLNGVTQGERE